MIAPFQFFRQFQIHGWIKAKLLILATIVNNTVITPSLFDRQTQKLIGNLPEMEPFGHLCWCESTKLVFCGKRFLCTIILLLGRSLFVRPSRMECTLDLAGDVEKENQFIIMLHSRKSDYKSQVTLIINFFSHTRRLWNGLQSQRCHHRKHRCPQNYEICSHWGWGANGDS